MSDLLRAEDLQIEPWPPRKHPGGQHVGTGPYGIKVTHLPTGIVACVEIGRSQFTNREIAMDMITAALTHPRMHR